ncbi:hypothetical protein BC361_23805 [Ensifer sp. LC54]|nr:hypothetical protein BC363_27080 [Ensifer sp. LC384]OCP22937.1 hypothetical protein BC361_23805 [Ensifer sp. LC54]
MEFENESLVAGCPWPACAPNEGSFFARREDKTATLSAGWLRAETRVGATTARLNALEVAIDVKSALQPVCGSAKDTTKHFADWFVSNPLARAYSRPFHLGVSQNLR